MFQDAYHQTNEAIEKCLQNGKSFFKQGWQTVECCNSTASKLGKIVLDNSKHALEQQSQYWTDLAAADTASELLRVQSNAFSNALSTATKESQKLYQASLECFEEWRNLFQDHCSDLVKNTHHKKEKANS